MKIKLFVAREIQYFELGIFSFNSYVYYLTRGFIASARAFNLATRVFSLLTRGFELVSHGFELVTRALHFHCYTTIYFFVKKFIFSNVYIIVNTIFECLSMFFG